MEREYKVLNQQIFEEGDYKLVPIRHEDRYNIMKWRNEQVYHLRQTELLNKQQQDTYFDNVVAKLFDQEQPNQILFSFLQNEECIGYGGLVHINWIDKNAEVSFILSTDREVEHFQSDWKKFLFLLDELAHNQLDLHKIFTFAFDIRQNLYPALENSGFKKEAVLKEHCLVEGKYLDVIIHSKYYRKIDLIEATKADFDITYKWATDPLVRKFSFDKTKITLESHRDWFFNKLKDPSCFYKIAVYNKERIGSFRLDVNRQGKGLISFLLSPEYHGMGLGTKLLTEGVDFAQKENKVHVIIGEVMVANQPSVKAFEKLGFSRINDSNEMIQYQLKVK